MGRARRLHHVLSTGLRAEHLQLFDWQIQVYALTSSHVPSETLDLFVTQEAAEAELREILEDEPEWVNVLRVVPIELDGRDLSAN